MGPEQEHRLVPRPGPTEGGGCGGGGKMSFQDHEVFCKNNTLNGKYAFHFTTGLLLPIVP